MAAMIGYSDGYDDGPNICEICGAEGPMIYVDYEGHGEAFCDDCVRKMYSLLEAHKAA